MKNILISRICSLTIICFLGFSPIAYLHAQQAVTVTPDVKADALRRLDLSRSAQISQRMVDKDGLWLRICNKGPKPSDQGTQEEACSRFLTGMTGDFARARSLDDLLPAFKSCVLSSDCGMSIEAIAESGHPDYALALAEYAPNCKGCVVLGEVIPNNAAGAIRGLLYLGQHGVEDNDPNIAAIMKADCYIETPLDPNDGPPRKVCKHTKEYIELGSVDDVQRLLERGCVEAGRQSACRLYQVAGGSYDETERLRAALAIQNEDAAENQARRNQESLSDQAEAASQQRWSHVTAALQSASSTTPSIQDTAAQQQANLAAMAAQRQQQARTVAPSANTSTSTQTSYGTQQPSYSPPPTSSVTSATTASPQQGQCTDMTNFVSGRAEVKGSEVIGWLTNNSGQDLYVFYTFAVNGVPSNSMANAGAGSLLTGRTNGGEGGGMYTYSADKNPGRIYWYAVPLSQKNAGNCSVAHKW